MFYDRHEAGRQLAGQLKKYQGQKDAIVLGLARGGVVTAYEVAKQLSLPLNAIIPKKIGAPGNPELAIGAIMENGEAVYNDHIIHALGISRNYIDREAKEKQSQAQARAALYRQYAPLPAIKGHTVILVDDGVATGATMLASIKGMRLEGAKHIVVAVPVASTEALFLIEKVADEVVCLDSEEDFGAVGFFYADFSQTEDEEVIKLLKELTKAKAG